MGTLISIAVASCLNLSYYYDKNDSYQLQKECSPKSYVYKIRNQDVELNNNTKRRIKKVKPKYIEVN